MVEVLKTNVDEAARAEAVLLAVRRQFPCCRVNFDLQDCDRLLRVECPQHAVAVEDLMAFLGTLHVNAEVLEDVVPEIG